MQRVFISYASAQQAVARELENELAAKGVNAWRDKTNLHAGERWPKALGDAIADSETLILLWSAEAEQSDFVELEWNIAVAMKKPVMPCLLDATPLPATLKPSHRISGNDMPKTADHILSALKEQPPVSVPTQQTILLNTLTTVQAAESKQVLHQIKAIINQPNWSVGGNVYQAHGDIHFISDIDKTKKYESTNLDTWVKLVGLGVAGLTFVGLLLDVPTKFMNLLKDTGRLEPSPSETRKEESSLNTMPTERGVTSQADAKSEDQSLNLQSSFQPKSTSKPKPIHLKLSGIVTDRLTGEPLAGAKVTIPSLKMAVDTDAQGFFSLNVINGDEERLLITVQKDQYETYRAKATPGNTNLGFPLRRKS